ncbi:uridine kinase family protein [Angustibacter aerolatus]
MSVAPAPAARVVVLAGPSGSGKSHLAARLGLPVLRLDDFYRDGDDPALPRAFGIVDWDDPASWDRDRAVATMVRLCTDGAADVPEYDIPTSRVTGHGRLELQGAPLVVAEGIFAAEAVPALSEAGVLADALCLTHRPVVTFARRLARDLHEHRKPPLTLVRRGLGLLRAEPRVVARQVSLGAVPCTPREALARIRALAAV